MLMKSEQARKKRVKGFIIVWSALAVIGMLCILYFVVNGLLKVCENAFAREKPEAGYAGMIQGDWQGDMSDGLTGNMQENVTGSPDNSLSQSVKSEVSTAGRVNTISQPDGSVSEENAELAEACRELYEDNRELLVLVNKDHELEEGAYEDTLRSICNGRLQASDYLYDDLVDLLAAAKEEGYQYWIASAYRSRKRQQELVDEDVARYRKQGMSYREALAKTYELTMPAGKSEHETGLALDILCSENVNMDISQADEPGNKWLAEHAHEYGFILRYPADKEDITGISYEPWHFRYVGKETAAFLQENELTLEEFWEYLK